MRAGHLRQLHPHFDDIELPFTARVLIITGLNLYDVLDDLRQFFGALLTIRIQPSSDDSSET